MMPSLMQSSDLLGSLRQQNSALLDQLRNNQHHFKKSADLLGTFSQKNASYYRAQTFPKETRDYRPGYSDVSATELDTTANTARVKLAAVTKDSRLQNSRLSSRYHRQIEDPHQTSLKSTLATAELDSTTLSKTLTSTPLTTPVKGKPTLEKQETPKSILKRRKIIDDNINVDSKYAHTPSKGHTHRNFNYSYSHVDDDIIATDDLLNQMPVNELDGSYLGEDSPRKSPTPQHEERPYPQRPRIVTYGSTVIDTNNLDSHRKEVDPTVQKKQALLEELERTRRMLDSGNDRQNANIVVELSKRPKTFVFDEHKPEPCSLLQSSRQPDSTYKENFTKSSSGLESFHRRNFQSAPTVGPLLGYDWIAGLLDNDSELANMSEDHLLEIRDFRRVNKTDCVSSARFDQLMDLGRPLSPEVKDPGHTCIHGFSVNERLFTEPVISDEDGQSVCPICRNTRKEPTKEEPGFIRVSIPRSTLETPYKIKPHRRRSFDPSDTFALGNHCLAGWESSKPSMVPPASTVDLLEASLGLRAKMSMTVSETGTLADSFSKSAQTTRDLLNTSHSLRYDMQQRELSSTLGLRQALHTAKYPALY